MSRLNSRVLNGHHNEMILKYLRFAILHRKRQVKEIEGIFEEYKDTRLGSGDSFTSDEVATLLDNLSATLKADVYRSLQIISNSNGILLKQLFSQAEDNFLSLTVDTSILEDELLLSMVQKLEDDAESQPSRSGQNLMDPAMATSLGPAKLPTLNEEKKTEELLLSNAALKKRQVDLEEEIGRLRHEMQKKESDMKTQISSLSRQLEEDVNIGSPTEPVSAPELAVLHRRIRELEGQSDSKAREAADLAVQLAAKIEQTPQFKSLKELLKQKNGRLQAYRDRLAALGWTEDDTPAQD